MKKSKKCLQISRGVIITINWRRTDHTMAKRKRTKNDLQNITQKNKDSAKRTSPNTEGELGCFRRKVRFLVGKWKIWPDILNTCSRFSWFLSMCLKQPFKNEWNLCFTARGENSIQLNGTKIMKSTNSTQDLFIFHKCKITLKIIGKIMAKLLSKSCHYLLTLTFIR